MKDSLRRLDVLLRGFGALSKRETREYAAAGRITVGGETVWGSSVAVAHDAVICIDGIPVVPRESVTIMMNKPSGYASVANGTPYPSVFSLLRGEDAGLRLFAVGRLDADTEGLLILTNDGGLNERIARPEREVGKTYYAEFDRPLCSDAAELLARGVILRNGEKCRPAKISFTGEKSAYITVTEGKYHEIKRLANACGAYVAYLKRVSIGGLTLDASLKPGEYRRMTSEETERIFASEYMV